MTRCRGEQGATLILALVVVLLASLIGVAVTRLTTTSLAFGINGGADRQASYAADGAVDWAITQVLQNQASSCWTGTVQLDQSLPVMTVGVSPTGGSGGAGGQQSLQCTFVVSGQENSVNYVQATVTFAQGPPTTATVETWVERPQQ
jgi:hypothetical protein